MITLHSVSKELGHGRSRTLVLDNISWVIPPRRRHVILAHRDAGKTTLLNVISGALVPTSGWVERRTAICPGRNLLNGLGPNVTPQTAALRLADLYRVPRDDVIRFVRDFANLNAVMGHPVPSLPPDMKLHLSYALIYAIPFKFYLFDDNVGPSRGHLAKACRQLFEMRTKNAGTILTTSLPKFAEQFRGAGGILYKGKIRLFKTVAEAISVFKTLPEPRPVSGGKKSGDFRDQAGEDWI